MVELTPTERLQPCLLDRLTDDEPYDQTESRDQRVMSMSRYREAVLRDMAWLLNTTNYPPSDEMEDYPYIADSVLNFGMPDFCGTSASKYSSMEVEELLSEAIRRFEPRILPGSVDISVIVDPDKMDRTAMSFEIEGDLWSQPVPEALYIKTKLDLETGQCDLSGGAHG